MVHVLIDVQDAMGANVVNTVAEGVAPMIEELTGGKVYLNVRNSGTTSVSYQIRNEVLNQQ